VSLGRRRTVDRLIQQITLQTMDVEAARTAEREVVMAASRIVGSGFPLPKLTSRYFSNREARDRDHFGLMIRATAHVPWINGFTASVEIDGQRFLDGGLVHRVPLSLVPECRFDEIWIAACSPSGRRELDRELEIANRQEKLVIITPSEMLPLTRWTMEWTRLERAIELGRKDMVEAIRKAR
jgi:predicted patatin/cPLA2 family phospholipase